MVDKYTDIFAGVMGHNDVGLRVTINIGDRDNTGISPDAIGDLGGELATALAHEYTNIIAGVVSRNDVEIAVSVEVAGGNGERRRSDRQRRQFAQVTEADCTGIAPVKSVPPVLGLPPVADLPPVTAVPPVLTLPPRATMPPVPFAPPVLVAPATGLVPPVACVLPPVPHGSVPGPPPTLLPLQLLAGKKYHDALTQWR